MQRQAASYPPCVDPELRVSLSLLFLSDCCLWGWFGLRLSSLVSCPSHQLYSGPETSLCIRITWRACYHPDCMTLSQRRLGCGLRICISNRFPGDVHDVYLRDHFQRITLRNLRGVYENHWYPNITFNLVFLHRCNSSVLVKYIISRNLEQRREVIYCFNLDS